MRQGWTKNKWPRKAKEIAMSLDPACKIGVTRGGHLKVTLSNGSGCVITAFTPRNEFRTQREYTSDIKRKLKCTGAHTA